MAELLGPQQQNWACSTITFWFTDIETQIELKKKIKLNIEFFTDFVALLPTRTWLQYKLKTVWTKIPKQITELVF